MMVRTHSPYNPPLEKVVSKQRSAAPPYGITVEVALFADATAIGDAFGIYGLMAEAGPVTAMELGARLHLHAGYVQPWLVWQERLGYLNRDEYGRYAPYCSWPRIGF
jgi:hypothetical protein